MRLVAIALLVCAVAHAHTPEYSVLRADLLELSKHFPPKLERAPLPPFAVWSPWPGIIVPVVAP